MLLMEWDQNEYVEAMREDAREEGREEGLKEANLENARRMKADNMSLSQISKYTGLSTETITQL